MPHRFPWVVFHWPWHLHIHPAGGALATNHSAGPSAQCNAGGWGPGCRSDLQGSWASGMWKLPCGQRKVVKVSKSGRKHPVFYTNCSLAPFPRWITGVSAGQVSPWVPRPHRSRKPRRGAWLRCRSGEIGGDLRLRETAGKLLETHWDFDSIRNG